MARAIVAVHSASRCTGIVRRAGNTLTGWWLFTHADYPLPAYVQAVVDRLATLVVPGDRLALVALPSPTALLGHGASYGTVRRAVLLGALLAAPAGWAPLLARPALYGSWRLGDYPAELVGPRERLGAGRLRACRAAWDLAGTAMPDGPPTAAADRARLGELATVVEQSESHWPGWRVLLRTCQVCAWTSPATSATTTRPAPPTSTPTSPASTSPGTSKPAAGPAASWWPTPPRPPTSQPGRSPSPPQHQPAPDARVRGRLPSCRPAEESCHARPSCSPSRARHAAPPDEEAPRSTSDGTDGRNSCSAPIPWRPSALRSSGLGTVARTCRSRGSPRSARRSIRSLRSGPAR